MSTNRENVTWQNQAGKWRNGFYPFSYVNQDSPDFDYEWDVEYNYDRLTAVSREFATADEAYEQNTKGMSNPGGTYQVPFTEANRTEIERLERLAAEYRERQQAAR